MRGSQEAIKERRRVESALVHGPEDAGEHLLRLRAPGRAIPAADFARDDGRPQRVFGAPIGGVNGVGFEQEGKHGRELDGEMRREMAGDAAGARSIDEGVELIVHMPPSHGQPVGGDRAAPKAVADRQRVLEHPLYTRGEVPLTVVADQGATPPQQMGETRLMNGLIEAAIGVPAIAHERAGEVRPQDGGRLLEAAPRQDGVDGRVRRGKGPQPVQPAPDFPAGFIGTDDVTLPHLRAQRSIGRPGAIGRAMQRVDEPAGGDGQAKAVAKQGADFPEGQPQLRVEDSGERDRLWPELRRGRTQRIGRLQRMAALHAAAAGATATNLDRERAHDRTDDREIFLVLPRGAGAAQSSATLRARLGQSRTMALVDMPRDCAMGFAAIRTTRPSARRSRGARRCSTRERGGLPIHLATGVVELVFEAVDLLAEDVPLLPVAVPVAIRSFVLAPESLNLALLPLQLRDQLLARRGLPSRLHAPVMPRSPMEYKTETLNDARRRPPLRSVTR